MFEKKFFSASIRFCISLATYVGFKFAGVGVIPSFASIPFSP
ncbi:hypothetical protein [Candidatus Lariskella endosymbiont of Hedychridium roseum]